MKFNPKSPVTGDYVKLIDDLARAALNRDTAEFERLSNEHEEYQTGARAHNANVALRDSQLMNPAQFTEHLASNLAKSVKADPAAWGEKA